MANLAQPYAAHPGEAASAFSKPGSAPREADAVDPTYRYFGTMNFTGIRAISASQPYGASL